MLWFLVFILFCCVYFVKYKLSQTTQHVLPPPLYGKLPIIGHGLMAATDSKTLYKRILSMGEYTNKHGGIVHAVCGPVIAYLITDPEDAFTVANTCFKKPYMVDFFNNWIGEGLVSGSGEVWQRHRKLLTPAFSLKVFYGFLEIFNSQAKQLIQSLEQFNGQTALKLSPYLKNYALTASCMTVFGTKDIHDKNFYSKYMNAVDNLLHIISKRITTAWLHNDTLNQLFGERNKENKLVETVRAMSDEVIKVKKNGYTNGQISDAGYKSFIDIMIEHFNNHLLTDQELKEEIDTTLLASFETTSESLEITLLILGSYPEEQEKVYKEIIEVCGDDGEVTKEQINKLVYTEAVIKECLRLKPVVPCFPRHIDKEVKLKNYTLRANTECILLVDGIHRSPAWGPDANEFKPERWLDSSSKSRNTKAFFGFGAGKRSCIGKTYAIILMKVVLTHFLRAFKVTADYKQAVFDYSITLQTLSGNEMSLQRRQRNTQ